MQIWSDFRRPKRDPDTGTRDEITREEAMLAYVAVTRAEKILDIEGLAWVHSPDYDLARQARQRPKALTTPKAATPPHRVSLRASPALEPAPEPDSIGVTF